MTVNNQNFFVEGSAKARMICDSIFKRSRLCSIEVEFPRPYLPEFNTHTRFSRNSASSRARPTLKTLASVLDRPYVPNSFGSNKSGMQAGEALSDSDKSKAVANWLVGRDVAVMQAFYLAGGHDEIMATAKNSQAEELGVWLCDQVDELVKKYGFASFLDKQDQGMHKQHANRVIEPYSFHTVIVTATHWRNFFGLRNSDKAQPEAQDFGIVVARAMMHSSPIELDIEQWHLPYVTKDDRDEVKDEYVLAQASAGKCARTSYLTHDGVRAISKDLKLFSDLKNNGHMSPLQHPARPRQPSDPEGSWGNYSPVWTQLRKIIPNEGDFTKLASREELLVGCRGDQKMVDFVLSLAE